AGGLMRVWWLVVAVASCQVSVPAVPSEAPVIVEPSTDTPAVERVIDAAPPKAPVSPDPAFKAGDLTTSPKPKGVGGPNFLPRPYTADIIREGLPKGSVVTFRIVKDGVEEKTRWTVIGSSLEEATFTFETWKADGTVAHKPYDRASPWDVLRDHATYPLQARVENTRVTVPIGERGAWLYTDHMATNAAQVDTVRYYFGYDEPGPPLLHTVTRDGVEVFRMEITERAVPSS
ncbi:MAG: hypothetical protein ACI9MC_004273, partial [Kiritimatiellia bacterium]